jgi:predicted RNA-binding protein (virulence factor B family)
VINIGKFNNMEIIRKADFGYYLNSNTGDTSDDILLPNNSTLGQEFNIGDSVEAFIYRDSEDRLIATLKKPLAEVDDLAYLEVVSSTKIGTFINVGLEKDILVPFKEENYRLEIGNSYLFYIYLDKTGRIAATTYVESHLGTTDKFEILEEVTGTVYGFQTNGTVMLAIDDLYKAVILRKEYFSHVKAGEKIKVRVKSYFEDGKIEVTPRKDRFTEMDIVEEKILEYLNSHDGEMIYNDKSSPEEIKKVFNTSKNYFKNTLGGLMKRDIITQDKSGTKLK